MRWQLLSDPADHYTNLAFRADGAILIAGARGGAVAWWAVADGRALSQSVALNRAGTWWCRADGAGGVYKIGGEKPSSHSYARKRVTWRNSYCGCPRRQPWCQSAGPKGTN